MKPKRPAGPRLGELLATRGRLEREALVEVLRHQRASGGRLGTCLVELEKISEDDLFHVLSDQLKVPFTPPEDLRSLPEEVIKLVPEKVARQRFSIPLKASSTHLTVAMRDPTDLLALDELSFVTGKRIRPQAVSEIRMLEALAKYYGVELASRFVNLLDRLNRERFFWNRPEGDATQEALVVDLPPLVVQPSAAHVRGPAPASPSAPAAARSATAVATMQSAEILAPIVTVFSPAPAAQPAAAAASAAPAPSPVTQLPPPPSATAPQPTPAPVVPAQLPVAPPAPPAATPAPPPPPAPAPATASAPIGAPSAPSELMSLGEAELRLRDPSGRDEVGKVLLEFARGRAASALLLMVRRDEAAGWLGFGPGLDDESVESCRVDLLAPSFVRDLRDGAASFRGALAELPSHAEIRAMLSTNWATDLCALPVRLRDRLVSVLVVTLEEGVFSPERVEELGRLAALASAALEQLVLRQKQHG